MPARFRRLSSCRPSLGVPLLLAAWIGVPAGPALAAGGTLTVEAEDEATGEPTVTRMELRRQGDAGQPMTVRRTVPAGFGFVLDRSVDLTLRDGTYEFRAVRGPEYRVVSGHFTLDRESLDRHTVRLPRMIDMLAKGWTSGDCLVPPSPASLPLRMAAEDLHLATTYDPLPAAPIPGWGDREEAIGHEPSWVTFQAQPREGLVFYGPKTTSGDSQPEAEPLAAERLAAVETGEEGARVAIENPFAWPLPVWLASRRIDGMFVLGDWLRLDRKQLRVADGRGPDGPDPDDPRAVGYWAERIYWNALEAGFRLAPLAGCGTEGSQTPVGYNRLYVGRPLEPYEQADGLEAGRVTSPEQWWQLAWRGHSVATNGPLLRPRLGGRLPGHRFAAGPGEKLELAVELSLTVRDPVQYLEVVHNGRVHYSARLDEFARSGGQIPPVIADRSGWVLVRVVTEYPDHFRAAISAPWYVEFEGQRRVTVEAVEFFRRWLADYEARLKQLPADELTRHVPYVRSARAFWARRAAEAEAYQAATGER